MKTRIKRCSKRSLAMLLGIILVITTIGAGTVFNVNATTTYYYVKGLGGDWSTTNNTNKLYQTAENGTTYVREISNATASGGYKVWGSGDTWYPSGSNNSLPSTLSGKSSYVVRFALSGSSASASLRYPGTSSVYKYKGEGNGTNWSQQNMTVSADGYYEYYYVTSTTTHQFLIGTSSNANAYNKTYVSSGFNNTNVTNIGNYGDTNCYCWHGSAHYILIYYPNTVINTSSNPKICASTTLPDDTPTYGITCATPSHGTLTTSSAAIKAGATATITATPSTGYRISSVTIKDLYGDTDATLTASNFTNNQYTYTGTDHAVKISATYELAPYAITTVPGNKGTLTASPSSAASGSSVTLTAGVTNSNYDFDGVDVTKTSGGSAVASIAASSFSNGASGGTYSYTMPGAYPITVTSKYIEKTFNITVANDQNSSTTTVQAHPITTVNITAPSVTDYVHTGWTVTSGSISYNGNTYSAGDIINVADDLNGVTATATTTLTANFQEAENFSATVVANGHGTITGGTSFSSAGTLSAQADTGYHFVNWTVSRAGVVNIADTTSANTSFTVASNKAVTIYANFAETMHSVTISKTETGGSITKTSASAGIATTDSVTATAAQGYSFDNWTVSGGSITVGGTTYQSGSAIPSSVNPLTFNTTSDGVTITANFSENTYSVQLSLQSLNNIELGTLVTPGPVTAGVATNPYIEATPKTGYGFRTWEGTNVTFVDGATTARTRVSATGAGTAKANFRQTSLYLDVSNFTGWKSDNAVFRAKFGSGSYTTMTKVPDTDNIWVIDNVPSTATKVTFQRANPSDNSDWNNTGEQTINITGSNAGKNKFNVSGWNSGSWDASPYFPPVVYDVTVSAGTGGSVASTNTLRVGNTTSVTLPAATAEYGYEFDKWVATGGVTITNASSANGATIKATSAGTVTATFKVVPPQLCISGRFNVRDAQDGNLTGTSTDSGTYYWTTGGTDLEFTPTANTNEYKLETWMSLKDLSEKIGGSFPYFFIYDKANGGSYYSSGGYSFSEGNTTTTLSRQDSGSLNGTYHEKLRFNSSSTKGPVTIYVTLNGTGGANIRYEVPTYYTVTVQSENASKGYVASASVQACSSFWQTLPTATPQYGYKFKEWTTTSPGVTIDNPTSASGARVKATGAGGTVTATFEYNDSMALYVVGRFRYRSTPSGDFTYTSLSGTNGYWDGDATYIPFEYYQNSVYKLETNSSLAELSEKIPASSSYFPYFHIMDSTNSSSKKYFSPSANTNIGDENSKTSLVEGSSYNMLFNFGSSRTDHPVVIYYDVLTKQIWYYVPNFYDVSFTGDANGTVTIDGTTTSSTTTSTVRIREDYDYPITLNPATGYEVNTFTVDGVNRKSSLVNNVYTPNAGHTNHTVAATFKKTVYNVTYPTSAQIAANGNYTMTNGPTTATYQDNVSFTVTAKANCRILGVYYTKDNDASSAATQITATGSTYSFNMPADSVTIHVEAIKTYTFTVSRDTGISSLSYSYNKKSFNYSTKTQTFVTGSSGTATTTSQTITVDEGTTVNFTVVYATGKQYDSGWTVGTHDNTYETLSNAGVSANFSCDLTSKWIRYTITATPSPTQGGDLIISSDAAGENEIDDAIYNEEFYVTATPRSGNYEFNSFQSISGAIKISQTGNVAKFRMNASNASITGKFTAVTPVWGTNNTITVARNQALNMTANVSPITSISFILKNSNNVSVYPGTTSHNTITISQEQIASLEVGQYTLEMTAINQPEGINSSGKKTASQSITVYISHASETIAYYVDMHSITGVVPRIALLNDNGSIYKDERNDDMDYQMVKDPNSNNIYHINKATPISTGQTTVKVKIYLSGHYNDFGIITLNATKLTQNDVVWFEAANGDDTEFSTHLARRDPPSLVETEGNSQISYTRVFLAKPISWGNNNNYQSWSTIGVYYWGSSQKSVTWHSDDPEMQYIGHDDNYYYYSCKIPDDAGNIIFQGRGHDNTTLAKYLQTGNLNMNEGNFWVLGAKSGEYYKCKVLTDSAGTVTAVSPYVTSYYDIIAMNKQETEVATAKPQAKVGNKVTYSSSDTNVATVNQTTGRITPVGAGTATITVTVYGTIGERVLNSGNELPTTGITDTGALYQTYTTSVTITDPESFEQFDPMSYESQDTYIQIPKINDHTVGYINSVSATLSGVKGGKTYSDSGILTKDIYGTFTESGVQVTKPIRYKITYAKPNSDFSGYSNISLVADVEIKSVKQSNDSERYGFDRWERNAITHQEYTNYTKRTVSVSDSVETASAQITLDGATYDAKYSAYAYTDVTFNFSYYEYVPEVDADGKITYFYDRVWAGNEDPGNANFSSSHITRTYTLHDVEVRPTGNNSRLTKDSSVEDILAAAQANMHDVENNYYTYSINASSISNPQDVTGRYAMTVDVMMHQSPRTYTVKYQKDGDGDTYITYPGTLYYQAQVEITSQMAGLSANQNASWVNVDTGKELAIDAACSFRVKSDINIRANAVANNATKDNSSVVDYAGHQITHEKRKGDENDPTAETVEKLIQNFYIADFFEPSKVLDPNSDPNGNSNLLPYDDVEFVGGGVLYYGYRDDNLKPNNNALINQGLFELNQSETAYIPNKDVIQKKILEKILDNKLDDEDEELANSVAFGTEIEPDLYSSSLPIAFRYLPMKEYQRDSSNELLTDINGNYYTSTNSNTFRYSSSLGAYQYVYASKEENKETNNGRNMAVYSYYVYSYTDYDSDDVPYTAYKAVISDSAAVASTYWDTSSSGQ